VPDLLDLEDDTFRDLAMASFLSDFTGLIAGKSYMDLNRAGKNNVYALHEIECQDAIDAYNQTIDDTREKAKSVELMDDITFMDLLDPNRKYTGSYREMLDAGHRTTDF